jgi:C-methyltransferase C-terminal domain/Putative zinc binding domain/Methyltransferase domain
MASITTIGYVHKDTCRICGGKDLVQILDLGSTPPANAYLKKEDLEKSERSFPLALYFCRNCSLAQLLDVVHQDILFKDYHFLTSASAPSVEHFRKYAEEAIRPLIASPNDLVVDIGGNDGVLLSFVKDYARVLNVDPADNLAPISEANGVPFYPAFFTSQTADEIRAAYGKAKVVVANNVFAHTDPLQDVFKGVAKLIGDEGTFIFEVHWAKHFVEEGAFDQIYHEHLCFHSLHALRNLIESASMNIFDVQIVPMQGRSLRVFAAKDRLPTANVERVFAEERAAGLTDESTYHSFAQKIKENKQKLLALLRQLKAAGKKIVGYGAPAKGNTLLNYYGIGPDILEYLTDTTILKQGLYSPGMHIPIVSPDILRTDTPDYVLLLAWNFKDSILEKEKELRARGGKFIVTVPEVEVI